MALTKVPSELSSTPSIVDGGNATAITITSDEDLLVAKGSLDVATVGHELRASGYSAATRDGATVGSFTRLNSNGTILEFRKDSAAVGNISVISDDRMVFATADGLGLQFDKDNNRIIPCDATGGANSNVSLGSTGLEFKNLYLSGGAYLGGTAAANKLDSYEEGSWTPVLSSGTMGNLGVSRYTKVGRLVTCYTQMDTFSDVSSSTAFQISGLPFTADLGNRATTLGILASRVSNIGAITGGYLNTASPPKLLLYNTSGSSFRNLVHSDFSANNSLYISFTYFST